MNYVPGSRMDSIHIRNAIDRRCAKKAEILPKIPSKVLTSNIAPRYDSLGKIGKIARYIERNTK